MSEVQFFAAGDDFTFLITGGRDLRLLNDSEELRKGRAPDSVFEL